MKFNILFFAFIFGVYVNAQDPSDAAKHIAVGSSLAAGLAKEAIYDQSKGYEWETKDVLYTTLGGVLAGMAIDILTDNSRRRSGGGKSCGCLVAHFDSNKVQLPKFVETGTGDIFSEVQAAYLLN